MSGKYTVNEVEERSKVPASTLRQWERRYGFPMPERSESGYRLYSDLDLKAIEAMRRHVEDGVPASRAADLVRKQAFAAEGPRPMGDLVRDLVNALVDIDEERASEVLSEAFALHRLESVLTKVIAPAMVEIGRRWHSGEITTATEHFASNFVQGRLRGLASLATARRDAPPVIVACAPEDQHEIGALVLSVSLRRAGYRVVYVGANAPVADLRALAETVEPVAVLVSAVVPASVERLLADREELEGLAPVLVFGGPAFENQPELARSLGGNFFGNDVDAAVAELGRALKEVGA